MDACSVTLICGSTSVLWMQTFHLLPAFFCEAKAFYFYLKGQQTTITVNVLTPTDFPVDLYYLTDVSRSIEKESIKRLGQVLGNW